MMNRFVLLGLLDLLAFTLSKEFLLFSYYCLLSFPQGLSRWTLDLVRAEDCMPGWGVGGGMISTTSWLLQLDAKLCHEVERRRVHDLRGHMRQGWQTISVRPSIREMPQRAWAALDLHANKDVWTSCASGASCCEWEPNQDTGITTTRREGPLSICTDGSFDFALIATAWVQCRRRPVATTGQAVHYYGGSPRVGASHMPRFCVPACQLPSSIWDCEVRPLASHTAWVIWGAIESSVQVIVVHNTDAVINAIADNRSQEDQPTRSHRRAPHCPPLVGKRREQKHYLQHEGSKEGTWDTITSKSAPPPHPPNTC